MISESSRI